MRFVTVFAEGQTEREFIDDVLNPYMWPRGVSFTAKIVDTRPTRASEASHQGGFTTYNKAKKQLLTLLGNSSACLVTTMLDYYRLPTDYPGMQEATAKQGTPQQRVAYIESKLKVDINHPRFLPYLAVHDFEALLFSEPQQIAEWLGVVDPNKQQTLQAIRDRHPTPEDINLNNPPGKHISTLFPVYDKVGDGALIADAIGIDAMRRECPHFHAWLEYIEQRCKEA